eukprot:scaffold45006_cov29-Tisochrysis_lutea.AAC.5
MRRSQLLCVRPRSQEQLSHPPCLGGSRAGPSPLAHRRVAMRAPASRARELPGAVRCCVAT